MPADFIIVQPAGAPGAINLPELLAALRVVIPPGALDMLEECGPGDNPEAHDAVRRALGYPINATQES